MRRGRRRGYLAFTLSDRVAVCEVMQRQSRLRQQVAELLTMGCSQQDAATRLDMSFQRLHYHVRQLRRAFIEAGFGDYAVRQTRRKRRTARQREQRRASRKRRRAASKRKVFAGRDL
ncbi:MAG: hypothetical protein ISS72_02500 [Candidatus Brocadiae bacterium]|nr:hypothetical protein [Candidatus Brocadiia bacterium]